MPGFTDPGAISQQQVAELISAAVAPYALAASVPQYIGDTRDSPMPYEALFAAFPPNAARRGMIARISNYGGSWDSTMVVDFESVSGQHFYRPRTAPQSFQTIAMTGNATVDPVISGDVLNLTGTIGLGVTRTVTLSTLRGRPGDIKTVRNGLSTLLGGLNILGTGLGSGVASLLGATSTYGCQWNSATSQLEWTRLT